MICWSLPFFWQQGSVSRSCGLSGCVKAFGSVLGCGCFARKSRVLKGFQVSLVFYRNSSQRRGLNPRILDKQVLNPKYLSPKPLNP